MWLVDGLVAREKHDLHSPLAIDDVRARIGTGSAPFGPMRLSSSPFVVRWRGQDDALLSLAGLTIGRSRRLMFVHLTSIESGTAIDATTRLDLFPVAITAVMFSVFALFGYAETSYYVSHGSNIFQAMFPFGYLAFIPLLAFLMLRPASADQVDMLLSTLDFVVNPAGVTASSVQQYKSAYATASWPPRRSNSAAPIAPAPVDPAWPPPPPANLPPPPVPASAPAVSYVPAVAPPPPTFFDSLLARHSVRLTTQLSVAECHDRLDPLSSAPVPFHVDTSDDGELVVTNAATYARAYRGIANTYEMRVRLVGQASGTWIEATTEVVPRFLWQSALLWITVTLFTFRLLMPALHHPANAIGFFPVALLWLAIAPATYFGRRHQSAGQANFLVTTLEQVLAATPTAPAADRSDVGVR